MKTTDKGNEVQPKKYRLTAEERETIITFSDADEKAEIYTCNRSLIGKLKKIYKLISENNHSATFECDKSLISFRSGKKQGRKLTEEHKEKLLNGRKKS